MSKLVSSIQFDVSGDFSDNNKVWQSFLKAVNDTQGLLVLSTDKFDFSPQGLSGLVLIGESHVAIHTWPELNKAFIELVTCGNDSSLFDFQKNIAQYWSVHTDNILLSLKAR